MIELIHDLGDWVVGFAGSDWAVLVLGFSSFIEAIFFPIPPDALLIGMGIIQPNLAIWFGVLVTVTSVAGALVGHWLGLRLGRPLLQRWFPSDKVEAVERLLQRYGVWAVLLFAITPLPYKVFAITAGALDLDRRTFMIASLVGRGARFITIGVLLFFFGEEAKSFIGDNFEVLSAVVAAALIAGAIAVGVAHRRRRAGDPALRDSPDRDLKSF